MKRIPSQSRLGRALSAGLGVALLSGAFLAGAAPAQAADGYGSVSGEVSLLDAAGASSVVAGLEITIYPAEYSPEIGTTAADGSFSFTNLADGTYLYEVSNPASEDYGIEAGAFTVASADLVLEPIVLKTFLPEGTVTVTGDPVVGKTLTISSDGWPAGTTLSYGWGYSTGQSGGPIEGVTTATYTVEADYIGNMLSAFVVGTKEGFAPTTVALFMETAVTAPKAAAAPAPVASSDGLGSFLVSKGSTPQPQSSAGLPAGSLDPSKGYEATVGWLNADSFVDVYLYSTPVFVGTFPVVAGVVQIDLSAEVLGELGAGGHTLVVLGQSTGAVSSVEVSVAAVLASTGVDATGALGAAGILVLLGGVALVVARRTRAKA